MTTYKSETDDSETDAVFAALAHASRRRMLDILRDRPGLSVGELATRFDTSRISPMSTEVSA